MRLPAAAALLALALAPSHGLGDLASASDIGATASPGRCGPLFGNKRCECDVVDWALYCNEANGWCGNTDAHRDAQPSTQYDCITAINPAPPTPPPATPPTPDPVAPPGRCGPLFGNKRCECDVVDWALYCNEANGWCGNTDAHRDAQPSTQYDCISATNDPTPNPVTPPTTNPVTPPTTPPPGTAPGVPSSITLDLAMLEFNFAPREGCIVGTLGGIQGASPGQCAWACAALANCGGFVAFQGSNRCALSAGEETGGPCDGGAVSDGVEVWYYDRRVLPLELDR